MVCRVCQEVLYHQKGRKPNYTQLQLEFEHQASYQNLVDTANTKSCYICSVLRGRLRPGEIETRLDDTEGSSKKLLSATLEGFSDKPGLYRLYFKVQSSGRLLASFVIKEKDASNSEAGRVVPISRTTNADGVIEIARGWVKNCITNHKLCQNTSRQEYPTRLVHIRKERGETRLRLVSQKRVPEEERSGRPTIEGRYASLSHCWGGNLTFKTTPSTLQPYLEDIPIDRLPATFQDAITFTHKLGIEWIWIDALCIIQDQPSKEDWLLEVSQMRQYYRNSFLNISATDARDGSEGLFRSRDEEAAWAEDVTLWTKELKRSHGSASNNKSEYARCTILNLDFWQQAVETAPVNLRSWVFQERILAPRVIHFCHDQIAFECREQDLAECRPDGLPIYQMQDKELVEAARLKSFDVETGKRLVRARLGVQKCRGLDDNDPQVQRLYLYELWKRLVDVYTKLGLSDQNDRLVALSGIAREMAAEMKFENGYIAGMWQESLASQILWRVNEGNGMCRQPFEDTRPKDCKGELIYRAPSWSWASIETKRGIYFPEQPPRGSELFIKVNMVRLIYKRGDDMYGLLTDGYIILKGVLRKIELTDTRAPKLRLAVSRQMQMREPYRTQKQKSSLEDLQPARFHVSFKLDIELTKISTLTYLLFAILLGTLIWSILVISYAGFLLLMIAISIAAVRFSTVDLSLFPYRHKPAPSLSPHTSPSVVDDHSPNRYHWRLVKDGVPSGDIYENVFLDSPASQPSIFGPEGRVYCIPALKDDDHLTCLLVQSTESGDYGVRYRRVGLAKVSTLYGNPQHILDLTRAPGHNHIKDGQYYYMPKLDKQDKKQGDSHDKANNRDKSDNGDAPDQFDGESTICII